MDDEDEVRRSASSAAPRRPRHPATDTNRTRTAEHRRWPDRTPTTSSPPSPSARCWGSAPRCCCARTSPTRASSCRSGSSRTSASWGRARRARARPARAAAASAPAATGTDDVIDAGRELLAEFRDEVTRILDEARDGAARGWREEQAPRRAAARRKPDDGRLRRPAVLLAACVALLAVVLLPDPAWAWGAGDAHLPGLGAAGLAAPGPRGRAHAHLRVSVRLPVRHPGRGHLAGQEVRARGPPLPPLAHRRGDPPSAPNDRLKAMGLGYLTHLAADTIAHNLFIPRQLVLTSSTAGLGHSYWEARMDTHLDERLPRAGAPRGHGARPQRGRRALRQGALRARCSRSAPTGASSAG